MDNKIRDQKIRVVWAVILLAGLIAFFATGCKPKEIITERTITKADSTAIWNLQMKLAQKEVQVSSLELELNKTKSENTRLNSEIFRLETLYDTSKPVDPSTGKPPVQSEITTIAKSELERTIQEKETLIQEFRREVETLTTKNSNLELEVESLRQENSDLKTKTVPVFNFKSFLWGMAAGAVLLFIMIILLKR